MARRRCLQVVAFAADERYRLDRRVEYADVYHSANRYAVSAGHFPIVLPRTIGWNFIRQRLVLGRECMMLQGHTVHEESSATETQLQDLAGNALLAHIN